MDTNTIKTIELDVVDFSNKKVGTINLTNVLFNTEINEFSVQKAVKVDLANRRQATAKTKGISEVRGSGKKPWRQKGTGRARAGSRRSPIWVGGATIFGPTGVQNFKLKINKQEHFIALTSVLTEKVNEKKVSVIADEKFTSPKTKDFVKFLQDMNLADKKVLFVIGEYDDNFVKACRNIPNLTVVSPDNVSVYDVLYADQLVFTKGVIEEYNEIFNYELGFEGEAK